MQENKGKATGHCLDCGRAISPKRLAAIPGAEYCVQHQPNHDRRHNIYSIGNLQGSLAVGSTIHASDIQDLSGGDGGWSYAR